MATLPSYWSVWAVTAIVVLAYALSVGLALRHESPEVYIHLGRTLVNKSQASPAIRNGSRSCQPS